MLEVLQLLAVCCIGGFEATASRATGGARRVPVRPVGAKLAFVSLGS